MTSKQRAVRSHLFSALAFGTVLSATVGFSATSFAQAAPPSGAGGASSNCPPGSWFCAGGNANAGASGSASAGGSAGGQLQQLPAETPAAAPAPAAPAVPAPGAAAVEVGPPGGPTPAPPPVVVYQPAPPVVVVQGRVDAPPPYVYKPRPANALPYNKQEWGLNLRLEGAILGRDRRHGGDNDAGMGGGGLGLRFKPSPYFGVEAGIDFLGGRDYYDNRRTELDINLSGLVFVNPRSRVQVYFPIGIDWARASVTRDNSWSPPSGGDNTYHYFGGHAGVGLEFRVSRHFALNLALLGFLRGRTDSDAKRHPEFVEVGTGRRTNTSGGGIFQGGMTIYF